MRWVKADLLPFSAILGMDHLADWLFGPGGLNYTNGIKLKKVSIPFLFLPLEDTAINAFVEISALYSILTGRMLHIPSIYRLADMTVGHAITAFGTMDFFAAIATRTDNAFPAFRQARKFIKLGVPLRSTSAISDAPLEDMPDMDLDWPDDTVVVATIDDGIAFAHERFAAPGGGTRIQCFWRQDGPADDAPTINVGREIWKASPGRHHPGIDTLIADWTSDHVVDEDAIYQQSQLVDFALGGHKSAAWRLAHGTAVLDIAAGHSPKDAPANRPIIAVQLPIETTANTSGSNLDVYAKLAVDYIVKRTEQLSTGRPERLPVVINMSYGSYSSSHDGKSPLELSLDTLISEADGKVCLVLPSGNGNLERCHALVDFDDLNGVATLHWRVQPESLTSAHVEIWMPYEDGLPPAASRMAVSLTPPLGVASSQPLEEEDRTAWRLRDDATGIVAELGYHFSPAPRGRGVFCISLQPTGASRYLEAESLSETEPVAPSGIWTISLHNRRLTKSDKVEAWIQRDDSVYGYPPRGRQSNFEDDDYQRFDDISGRPLVWDAEDGGENENGTPLKPSVIKRRGMINAIATGRQVIVVGGVRRDAEIAAYSAGGPLAAGSETGDDGDEQDGEEQDGEEQDGDDPSGGVDACAVSDDSIAHPGLLVAGARSGSVAVLNGTSVAAPQITRLVATLLGAHGLCDRGMIRQTADDEEQANTRPRMRSAARFGAGRIMGYQPDDPARIDPDFDKTL